MWAILYRLLPIIGPIIGISAIALLVTGYVKSCTDAEIAKRQLGEVRVELERARESARDALRRYQEAQERLRKFEDSIDEDVQENEEVRRWADTDIPEPVRERMRQLIEREDSQ
ncbi:MAG: hypothetical protein D6746_15010 [Bacteroidetes bacterium]|nr:MAG: hypothetical protein D6746_15010 [Bacteroidota bacterium]